MLDRLAWAVNRLRMMDLPEIGYRLKQGWRIRREAAGRGLAGTPVLACTRTGKAWLNELPCRLDAQSYCAAADRILDGKFDVFALRDLALGFPPCWNRDPKTGIEAPLMHGKRLNYRDEALVGDIKYLWELSRHLQITRLAQAYHLSRDEKYAEGLRTLLASWFVQCPYPLGPHWVSSLELAIRLMNWSCAWHLLGGEQSPLFATAKGKEFKRDWLDSIYRHCHFIAGYLSRHSSANNHLLGELSGLYVGALTWPCWHESAAWLALAREELESEAQKQNHPDGVNREQAIYYQHQVVDLMLHTWLTGSANGTPSPAAFIATIERMLEFIAAIMDCRGNVPMIGDADDGVLVRWSAEPDWHPYRSLLATGAVLFNRADFKRKAGRFDDKSRWLLGDAAERHFAALTDSGAPAVRTRFQDGGYAVLGNRFDAPEEIRLVADAGPLGYLSIAAHGHADALAFTLSVAGRPILIDPGTYAYHTKKKWRDYFRGTAAHNTVRVDGVDQSEGGGNFIWLRKANARCELWETGERQDRFAGSHDGYTRLHDPVIHRREILFLKEERKIVVEDVLECRSAHEVEFHWHFSEQCQVSLGADGAHASCEHVRVDIGMADCAAPPRLVSGQEQPPLGWISYRMDEKIPAPTIVWREKIDGPVRRRTIFTIGIN